MKEWALNVYKLTKSIKQTNQVEKGEDSQYQNNVAYPSLPVCISHVSSRNDAKHCLFVEMFHTESG